MFEGRGALQSSFFFHCACKDGLHIKPLRQPEQLGFLRLGEQDDLHLVGDDFGEAQTEQGGGRNVRAEKGGVHQGVGEFENEGGKGGAAI